MNKAKPFDIPKVAVWEAFQRVKANQGAAGVDWTIDPRLRGPAHREPVQALESFVVRVYMPPPVRRVDIPKANGGTLLLGIPTVADRIAQEVVRRTLGPVLEPLFHRDSDGVPARRSAIDAVRTARTRSWRYDWVVHGHQGLL